MSGLPAQAIILAAGRGERLRPWTDVVPKPLLRVGDQRLIEWHLQALARAGIADVVINTAWLEDQFPAALGDGSRYGLRIHWSFEQRNCGGALETAGGIAFALPRLAPSFWVISADVFVPDFSFGDGQLQAFEAGPLQAKLWLTANAPHHPEGDFGLSDSGLALAGVPDRLTWSSIGLFRASMFQALEAGRRMPLRPLLDQAAAEQRLGAARLACDWIDVGTPQRWNAAAQSAALRSA